VQHRRRTSCSRAFTLWLLAALPACAQTVVLEQGTPDGGVPAGNDGSFGDGSFGDGHCTGQSQTPKPLSPEVIVALDRSSTMAPQLSTVLAALIPEVESYQNVVRFGFIDFPDGLQSCPDSCCIGELTPPPAIPTSYTVFDDAAYVCNTPGAGGVSCPTSAARPTEVALRSCVSYYQSDPQSGGRFVLLITDGDPSGQCGDAKGDCADAENEVGTLYGLNNGVQTVIVDLGMQSNSNDCLHELATGQGQSGTLYYYFPGPDGLNDDLAAITNMIASAACHLSLAMSVGDPSQVAVSYFGTPVPPDKNDGWTLDTGNSTGLTLHGTACQSFINSRTYPQGLAVTSSGCSSGHGGQSTF
jgi:hypothetical protein